MNFSFLRDGWKMWERPLPAAVAGKMPPFRFVGRSLVEAATVAVAAIVIFTSAASAALEERDALYTVGTVIESKVTPGQQWAFVLWHTRAIELHRDRQWAIYAKPGEPASPALYQIRSITQIQTDPNLIKSIIDRSLHLGDDIATLENRVDDLFENILPGGNLKLEEKLAAVVLGAMIDDELLPLIYLLARLHPSVAMVLGQAFAMPIEGSHTRATVEVRAWDPSTKQDIAVLGRVTFDTAAPVLLPAPGAPVVVPKPDPQGHLNIRLRWATPDNLRRLAMMHQGYNVYRVDKQYAESRNWHIAPPPTGFSADLKVVRVNRLPVHPRFDLSPAEALYPQANPNDPEAVKADLANFSFADDNERFEPGGIPFVDGESFYYFVAARDILGRDGHISPGTLAVACGRMPPPPPMHLEVVNAFSYQGGATNHRLKLTWRQNTPVEDEEQESSTANYFIYRWSGTTEMNEKAGIVDPGTGIPFSNLIAGPIPHVPGLETLSYEDAGPGSPAVPQDAGKTFWYTVRAEAIGSCGSVFSGNSAPAFGVLRAREGPEAPTGRVVASCFRPWAVFREFRIFEGRDVDSPDLPVRLTAERGSLSVDWAEFYHDEVFLGRRYFQGNDGEVHLDTFLEPFDDERIGDLILCRVGMNNGSVSDFANIPLEAAPRPRPPERIQIVFASGVERIRDGDGRLCREGEHEAFDPDTGEPVSPEVEVAWAVGAEEYKLYRTIGDGPMVLIEQGLTKDLPNPLELKDLNLPVAGGLVCYYAQLFDKNGNASPLVQIGCVFLFGLKMPTPMLASLKPVGTEDEPEMEIIWFCSPHGLERFEIWIGFEKGTPIPAAYSEELSENLAPAPVAAPFDAGGVYGVYQTERAKVLSSGGGKAFFKTRVPIVPGVSYRVAIRGVGPGTFDDRKFGKFSNSKELVLSVEDLGAPDVPWPARKLPPITDMAAEGVKAMMLGEAFYRGVAIRIGEFQLTNSHPAFSGPIIDKLPWHIDPVGYLYKQGDSKDPDAEGKRPFPFVLYRYQEENANFALSELSGDIVQASPLMEQIAHQHKTFADVSPQEVTVVVDPFILLVNNRDLDREGDHGRMTHSIFMLDRQPVLRGAAYRYLLVRFGKDWEIDQVIATNVVEVGE